MQIKLLNDVIGEIIGKQSSELINILYGKKNLNEFIIAKKMKLTINQTRNLLYKLSDVNLVTFTRKKDKRKGWYTYFWTLDIEKSLELLEANISREMEALKSQLKSRESKRYYYCNTCKVEISEETGLLHNFTCNECGSVYDLQTDKKIINDLNAKIGKLESFMVSIKQELVGTRAKGAKSKSQKEKRLKKKEDIKKEKEKLRKKAEKKKNLKEQTKKKTPEKKKDKQKR